MLSIADVSPVPGPNPVIASQPTVVFHTASHLTASVISFQTSFSARQRAKNWATQALALHLPGPYHERAQPKLETLEYQYSSRNAILKMHCGSPSPTQRDGLQSLGCLDQRNCIYLRGGRLVLRDICRCRVELMITYSEGI